MKLANLSRQWRCLMLVSLVAGSGCAASSSPAVMERPETSSPLQLAATEPAEAASPVTLEVVQVANDGRMLHAVVRVTTTAPFDSSTAALRLAGFGEGALVRENVQPLLTALAADSKSRGPIINPGQPVTAYLALPVSAVSNYQVELLWGADARSVLAGMQPTPRVSDLIIEQVRYEGSPRCANGGSCSSGHKVSAQLVNRGSAVITAAQVLLALLPPGAPPLLGGKLDSALQDRDTSGAIRMAPLRIAPGGRQQVRVLVPEDLYRRSVERFGADITPHMEVQSFETASGSPPAA